MKFLMTALLLVIGLNKVFATNYLITTGVDGAIDNGNCTLREALLAADTQSSVDQCPAGTRENVIILSPNIDVFTFDQGEMVITSPQSLAIVSSEAATPPVVNMNRDNRFLSAELAGFFLSIGSINFAFGRDDSGNGGGVIRMDVATGISNLELNDVGFFNSLVVGADGGAIYYRGAGSLTMENVLFKGNIADAGSGLALNLINSVGFSTSSDVEFADNISNSGRGALNINSVDGLAILRHFEFTENEAAGGEDVAGVFIDVQDSQSNPSSVILNDHAIVESEGAGLYVKNASGFVTIRNLTLKDNHKPNGQGTSQAIVKAATDYGSVHINNTLIYQTGTQQGSGLVLGADDNNGAISVRHATILNHTIGVLGNSTATDPTSLELRNSILYGNLADFFNYGFDTDSLIGVNPLFINSSNEDFSLSVNSPAIDMGSEIAGIAFDLAGNPRVYNALPDIGAFERQGPINVRLTISGSGSGEVFYDTRNGLTDSCRKDCEFTMQSSEWLSLVPAFDSGSFFGLWGQDCKDIGAPDLCYIANSGTDINVSLQFIDESEIIFNNGFEELIP